MSFDPATPLPIGKLPAGFLGQLIASFGPADPDVLVGAGVGRDAAAIAFGDRVLVVKTDPITFAGSNAAAYLVDINANDLACLGATPRWMLVTALLPEGITAGEVATQFEELRRATTARSIALVGGHTEITAGLDRTMLIGCLIGETTRDALLEPGGARPGDRLLLSGALATEGTALLATELEAPLTSALGADLVQRAQSLLSDPGLSVLEAAQVMLATGGVTALHDVTEGGLAMAVREIVTAAGAGAEVDRDAVPILAETRAIATRLDLDPLGMLGSGSLLATATADSVDQLIAAAGAAGLRVTEIGRVLPDPSEVLLRDGNTTVPLPHFDTDEVSRALNRYRGHVEGKNAK